MAVDVSTLGWGTVQDRGGNALTGKAFTVTDASSTVVLSGTTDANGQLVGTLGAGTYTLTVNGVTKTVDVPSVSGGLVPATFQSFGHSYSSGYGLRTPASDSYNARLGGLLRASVGEHGLASAKLMFYNDPAHDPTRGGWPDVMSGASIPRLTAGPYFSPLQAAVVTYGINDRYQFTTNFAAYYPVALKAIVAYLRCASIIENDDAAIVGAGSGVTSAFDAAHATQSGANLFDCTATSTTLTISLPSHYPGTDIWLGGVVVSQSGALFGGTWGVTVDGAAQSPWVLGPTASAIGTNYPAVYKIPALTAGAHTIVLTATAVTSHLYFDWLGIEAVEPPPVYLVRQPRLPVGTTYTGYADSWVTDIDAAIASVVAAFSSRVTSVATDDLFAKSAAYFQADGIHPNADGVRLIAERLYAAVQAEGFTLDRLLKTGVV